MEALRTKIDGLQWEVHRLDAENRKLRAKKPELGERVDLAAELEQTKGDVAELMTQRESDKRVISDTEQRADSAERRAAELEARARTRRRQPRARELIGAGGSERGRTCRGTTSEQRKPGESSRGIRRRTDGTTAAECGRAGNAGTAAGVGPLSRAGRRKEEVGSP